MLDYGYASGGSARASCLNGTVNSCSDTWLSGGGMYTSQFTISPCQDSASSIVVLDGSLSCDDAGKPSNVYPSLYLKSNVILASGNGSNTNPYTLSMQ